MKVLVAAGALLVGAGFKAELHPPTVPLAPVINTVTITPSPAEVGDAVTFSVDATGGAGLTYQWDFGDGNVRSYSPSEATITHSYLVPGHFKVRINVLEQGDPTPSTVTKDLIVHFPITAVKPTNSSTIIYDSTNARVWCVNPDSDTVSAIDSVTHAKVLEVSVGRTPKTLAQAADGRIWVVSANHPSISILHPVTGALEHVLPLPHGSLPYGVCMTPDGTAAFVSFQGTGGVSKFSTSSFGVLATSSLPATARGIAVSATGRVFVTRFISPVEPPLTAAAQLNSHGEVVEFNTNLGFVRTIKLQLDPGPDTTSSSRGIPNYVTQIMITPDGRRAWVPSKKDNIQKGTSTVRDGVAPTEDTAMRTIISSIDLTAASPVTDLINERVDSDNSEMAQSACTSTLGDYIFIGIQGTNKVMVRDLYKNATSLNGFGTATTGLAPQGVVFVDSTVSSPTPKLFVQNFMTRDITVFDTTSVLAGAAVFSMPVLTKVPVVTTELLPTFPLADPNAHQDVLRGKQIFYNAGDTRMSQEGYISCAGCHLDGGSDARVWDFTDRGEGLRNTTMLQGRAGTGHGNVHWSANFNEIQDFANDIFFHFGGSGFTGGAAPNAPMGANNAGTLELDQLSAYVSSLTKVARSPFRNADGTLTASGQRGEAIFTARDCGRCHSGRNFTDSQVGTVVAFPPAFPPAAGTVVLHNVGTIKSTSGQRLSATLQGIDTPTLKGVWQTAPYFHDGSAPTLMDVLADASRTTHFGFNPLTVLTAAERADLVEYLMEIDELDAPATNSLTPAPSVTINSVSTGKPYSTALAVNDSLPWVDRSYRFNGFPGSPNGFTLIRTAEDDKAVTTVNHLTITVAPNSIVYVAYDQRGAAALPDWLTAAWNTTPAAIQTFVGQSAVTFGYYGLPMPAGGQVTLGGNLAPGASGALRNYFVVVFQSSSLPTIVEGPINANEWAHDQDADGDGLRDEFEVTSLLSPWLTDTGGANIPDEDKLSAGGGTFFAIQPALSVGGAAAAGGGGGGGGGCGLLGLEYLLPVLALRQRRRRRV